MIDMGQKVVAERFQYLLLKFVAFREPLRKENLQNSTLGEWTKTQF